MTSYIFSIGLIPVQEFIAEARRSRDLRAGSAILSRFMQRIIAFLRKDDKVSLELIIPYAKILQEVTPFDSAFGNEYSIPNRASGYITGEGIKTLFERISSDCLQAEWEALFTENFKDAKYPSVKMGEMKKYIENEFTKNPNCPFQVIWVLNENDEPENNSEEKCKKDMERINMLYGNIKRTRPVEYWRGFNIGKCDQCGKREAIGPKEDIASWRNWHRELQGESWVQKGERIDPGERLCIVCITKRFVAYKPGMEDFPSTSAIAARAWQRALQQSNIPEIVANYDNFERYCNNKELGEMDNLIYTRSLTQKRNMPLDNDKKERLKAIKNARKNLTDSIIANPEINLKTEPSNYLAVLTFDGDNMGRKTIEHLSSLPEQLFEFSKALYVACSESAPFNSAELFYVGGDEGLLLAPVDKIIDLAFAINELFISKTRKIDDELTLSIGIAIFDRERPLSGAITLAQKAIEEAKTLKNKNGLSLIIQTASGNEFSTTASIKGNAWKRISEAVKLLNAPEGNIRLSKGWAYEIENFLQSLPANELDRELFRSAATSELKRITFRKVLPPLNSEQTRKQAQQKVWNELLDGDTWLIAGQADKTIETVSNQLHTIAFLVRESSFIGSSEEKILQGEE